ncbi:MAG: phosphopantetheine-binding protein [Bdellovibrionota bacterium]
MTRDEILVVVKKNVLEVLDGLNPDEFSPTKPLTDLGADSLRTVEIISLCTRELRIKVPHSAFGSAKTADQLAELFHSHQGPK